MNLFSRRDPFEHFVSLARLPARPHCTYVCHLRGDEHGRLRGLVALVFATCVATFALAHHRTCETV
jgi:hypothetical protein